MLRSCQERARFVLDGKSVRLPLSCGSHSNSSILLNAVHPFRGAETAFAQLLAVDWPQAIGEDLFAIAVDQPFRFPATFTFVLRAFSTLEGIGKGLNPSYRFSDVATPYAQELLNLQVWLDRRPALFDWVSC
jgi:hypothetical protein